ncbi:MAG: ATPase, partial [Pseudonocardiales bacterium]
HGEPRLLRAIALNGLADTELLRLAASAEKFSEHPLGRAIVDAAEQRHISVRDPARFDALPGLGVSARTADGRSLLVGRPQLLAERGLEGGIEQALVDHPAEGTTVVAVALDDRPVGLLLLEDELRPEALPTVQRLQQLDLRTVLITGDQHATARRIAGQVGIDEVHAEVRPQDKARLVTELQRQGHKVAFVGDGINDGPALAAADVGVAMGLTGTDLALESAQIALLSDDLTKLPHLLGLSKRAMRAIRQNLAFSLGVLAIAVVLTIVGILRPVSGALLHELSSIPVIANSARLIGVRSRRAA